MKNDMTMETWKLDLERLLWSYHENGRPDGKTGVIGNPKTIEDFVQNKMDIEYHRGVEDGKYQGVKSRRGY